MLERMRRRYARGAFRAALRAVQLQLQARPDISMITEREAIWPHYVIRHAGTVTHERWPLRDFAAAFIAHAEAPKQSPLARASRCPFPVDTVDHLGYNTTIGCGPRGPAATISSPTSPEVLPNRGVERPESELIAMAVARASYF